MPLDYVYPKFERLDYVPYEEEREQHFVLMQDAIAVSERKLDKWEKEKEQHENYYSANMKTRIGIFFLYVFSYLQFLAMLPIKLILFCKINFRHVICKIALSKW